MVEVKDEQPQEQLEQEELKKVLETEQLGDVMKEWAKEGE